MCSQPGLAFTLIRAAQGWLHIEASSGPTSWSSRELGFTLIHSTEMAHAGAKEPFSCVGGLERKGIS